MEIQLYDTPKKKQKDTEQEIDLGLNEEVTNTEISEEMSDDSEENYSSRSYSDDEWDDDMEEQRKKKMILSILKKVLIGILIIAGLSGLGFGGYTLYNYLSPESKGQRFADKIVQYELKGYKIQVDGRFMGTAMIQDLTKGYTAVVDEENGIVSLTTSQANPSEFFKP